MRKSIVAAVLLALVVALCACSGQDSQQSVEQTPAELTPKALNDYSWEELSRISAEIAAAESDEAGRAVAQHYGLVREDGSLSTDTKQIVLNDTRALDIRLAGIRHDDRADGAGKAGITFMTVGAIVNRQMNDEATVEGGWEASSLRAWIANEVPGMLDADLRDAIVPVSKLTNNVGFAADSGCVTATTDSIWVFSVHEVCGDVSWDIDEFRQLRGYEDVDGILNSEGWQYEVFSQAGVTGTSGAGGFLSLADSTGSKPWWYRSPYPFEWQGYGDTGSSTYFYRVMDSGYPKSTGAPNDPESSVVVGFCV